MIKVLIVDDEPRARHVLENHIIQLLPEISEIRMAASVKEALKVLEVYDPGIVFLDIEMPQQNGFDLILAVPNPTFDVIFTTAYNQYAIQAVRSSALDYLLKPIDPDELVQSVKRHLNKPDMFYQQKQLNENLSFNIRKKEAANFRLAVPSNNGIFFFDTEEIIRLEADRNYTVIHFRGRRPFLASKTLRHFEEMLDKARFIRTHKSHLINLEHIIRITNNSEFITLSDGSKVQVSRRKKEELQKQLNMR